MYISPLVFLFGVFAISTTALPSPPLDSPEGQKLCPIYETGILNFDDLNIGDLSGGDPIYKGFQWPGRIDWYVVDDKPGTQAPYHKGVFSKPNCLFSPFRNMVFFNSNNDFTFDLISMRITGLTADTRLNDKNLNIRFVGFKKGKTEPTLKKTIKVANAWFNGGPTLVKFGPEWRDIEQVGIMALDTNPANKPNKPGVLDPGFAIDDVKFSKRRMKC